MLSTIKKFLSVLLCAALLFGSIAVGGEGLNGLVIKAAALESTGNATFDAFINNSTWTDGVWWGDRGPEISPYDCRQCCAYAADFVKYCFGGNAPNSGEYFTGATNIRAGDVLLVGNGSNGYGHWFVCLKRSGNSLYVAEGNCDEHVRIGWNYTIVNDSTISGASYSFSCGWHYSSVFVPELVAAASTSGSHVSLYWTDIGAQSYYVYTYHKDYNVVTFEQNYGRNCSTTLELADGNYTGYITATMYDGTQKSIALDFSLPSTNTFSLSSKVVNRFVGLAWQNIGADSYWVWISNSQTGQEVYSASAGTQTFTYFELSNGNYNVTVTATMPGGSTRQASTSFTIGTMVSLSIDPNGGQIDGNSSVNTKSLFAGDTVTLRNPQRDGYTFVGWSLDGAGELEPKSLCYPYGMPIYSDETFYENISVYNNNQNGAVTHTLINTEENCPSVSDKMIRIATNGNASPSLGGFYQYTVGRVKGVYYHIFKAKVPVGYTLKCASNDIGYQGKMTWLTDHEGTGKWETYIYRIDCGHIGGDQLSFGHVYVTSNNGSNTVTWYLCASNIYEATGVINGQNTDPLFTVRQPLSVYNNMGNGSVSLTRLGKTDSTCPGTSSYYLQIKTTGAASPGLGGAYFPVQSKPNGVFYQVMVAKIPVGYELERASNSIGDGYTIEWLTDKEGTGDWETYVCRINCGSTGEFGHLGYWYIKPLNGQTTVTWYVCLANCFDSTPTFTAGNVNTTLTAQWMANQSCVHDYTTAITLEPTCTGDGVKTYTCSLCGDTCTEAIPALGHDYIATVTPPTCVDDGFITYTCSRCGDSYTDVVPATGHTYSDWMMLVDPTLTSEGVMGRKCTVCGVVLDEIAVPKLAGDHVTGLRLSAEKAYLDPGEALTLTAEVLPAAALNKTVAWSSSNPAVATVENGVVTAAAPGITNIIAKAEDGGVREFCLLQVSALTAKNGAVIDNGTISGLSVNLNSLDDYLTPIDESMTVETNGVIGTSTKVLVKQGNTVINEFETVLFGDVNGDGWYDGTDAYFVSLVANGLISQSALTAAQLAAADANHDGNIDNADVALIERAGLLLNEIDQTATPEELQTNSAYLEYCSLIDQTVEITESDQPAQPAEPAGTDNPQPAAQNAWAWFRTMFRVVLNWIYRIFNLQTA